MKSQCAFGAIPWNIYQCTKLVGTTLYSIIIQFVFDDRSTISHISNIELFLGEMKDYWLLVKIIFFHLPTSHQVRILLTFIL